jgi:hypothetical protein
MLGSLKLFGSSGAKPLRTFGKDEKVPCPTIGRGMKKNIHSIYKKEQ